MPPILQPIGGAILKVLPGLLLPALLLVGAGPPPARADVEVLVPGASRTVLITAADTLTGGGDLRSRFDKVFWFPDSLGTGGYLFINHELAAPSGGLSRLRYEGGVITEAVDWVIGTHNNCSGSVSSWGSILSCEEFPPDNVFDVGFIVEAEPGRRWSWKRQQAMGRFSHESIIEDPLTGDLYMTDDSYTGVFFRFVPFVAGELDVGSLYAYREDTGAWLLVTDLLHARQQAIQLGATTYPRAEDLAYDPLDDSIYIMVTGRLNTASALGYIMRFDPRSRTMTRWLDGDGQELANPDNVEIDSWGNLLVCEDMYPAHIGLYGYNELLLIRPDRTIQHVLRGLGASGEVTGLELTGSEERFWINWMGGPLGSELIEVDAPPGWNAPGGAGAAASTAAPPPGRLRLIARPNPVGERTLFNAPLAAGEQVRLEIFDVQGRHCCTLLDGAAPPGGSLRLSWNRRDARGRRLARGAYFARLRAGDRTSTVKLLLGR